MRDTHQIKEFRDLHITATAVMDMYLNLVEKEERQSTKMSDYRKAHGSTPPEWSLDLMQIRREKQRALRSYQVVFKEIKEKSLPFKPA